MERRNYFRPGSETLNAIHAFYEVFGVTPEELLENSEAMILQAEISRLQKALPAPRLDPKQIVKDAEELLREALNK